MATPPPEKFSNNVEHTAEEHRSPSELIRDALRTYLEVKQ